MNANRAQLERRRRGGYSGFEPGSGAVKGLLRLPCVAQTSASPKMEKRSFTRFAISYTAEVPGRRTTPSELRSLRDSGIRNVARKARCIHQSRDAGRQRAREMACAPVDGPWLCHLVRRRETARRRRRVKGYRDLHLTALVQVLSPGLKQVVTNPGCRANLIWPSA